MRKTFWKKSFYCGDGKEYPECMKCQYCKYYDFLEWAQSVAPPGSSIQRDVIIEVFDKKVLPEIRELIKKEEDESRD